MHSNKKIASLSKNKNRQFVY